jgi:rod shape-determining protein MreD
MIFFFVYTCALTLFLPVLFPHLALLYFAPFLILSFYSKNKLTALWLALICGLIIDLFSTHARLGLNALNYCIVTWFLYPQKYHFFEDSVTTLPIMTLLFSLFSTIIQVALFYLFDQRIALSWNWIKNDLLWLPIVDAIYAALGFSLLYILLPRTTRSPEYE